MSELSDEAKAALDEAPLDDARPEEIESLRQRVYASLGMTPPPLGDGGAAAPTAPPAAPVGSVGAGAGLLKGVVAGAVVVAAVGGYAVLQQGARERNVPAIVSTASTPEQPAHEVAAPPALVPSAAPAPSESAAPARALPRRNGALPSASAPPTQEEKAREGALMVAAAEAHLRAGQPAAALSLYDRYLREYPGGVLRQESQAGRIVSLCAMGQVSQGSSELERFAADYPRSPTLARLRRACGSEP